MFFFKLFSAFLLISIAGKSQSPAHKNLWTRLSFANNIDSNWKAEMEFQHRSQSDFANKSNNLFSNILTTSVRTWIHYSYNKNITLSLSPFAYFNNYAIIISEQDKLKEKVVEYRYSAVIELRKRMNKFTVLNKFGVEYRDLKRTSNDVIRLRNKIGLTYTINKKLNVFGFYELLLRLNKNSSAAIFDHNRFAIVSNYTLNSKLRFEIGYMYINRSVVNYEELIKENNIIFHTYITLPHFFKHKN